MKFTKMHGCGNDYVYVNGFEEKIEDEAKTAVAVSDRHFGVGADGLIIIKPSDIADFEMVMYNADGSRAQMCGNGIRCVAKYVYDNGLTDKKRISVVSMGAVKYIDINVENGVAVSARVDMGKPVFKAKDIPVMCDKETAVNEKITVNGEEYKMTCVSMGNPHAVIFTDIPVSELELEKIGPAFEHHPAFPERVNAEFVNIKGRKNLDMRVWERGTGETLACGTGACASVAAAVINGLADNEVTVHLRGGVLEISWNGSGDSSVFMTGPAASVFTGETDL